jgi:ABC-type Fe3+ transport system permease subunit
MNATNATNLYADSPERMLLLSILLLVATALLVLYNHWSGKKRSMRPAAPSAELPSMTKPDQTPWHWVGPKQHQGPG